jgi:hypothetical protein
MSPLAQARGDACSLVACRPSEGRRLSPIALARDNACLPSPCRRQASLTNDRAGRRHTGAVVGKVVDLVFGSPRRRGRLGVVRSLRRGSRLWSDVLALVKALALDDALALACLNSHTHTLDLGSLQQEGPQVWVVAAVRTAGQRSSYEGHRLSGRGLLTYSIFIYSAPVRILALARRTHY